MNDITDKPIICFSIGYTPDFNQRSNGVYGAEFALKSFAEELIKTHRVFIFGASLNNANVNFVNYSNSNSLNKFMKENIIDVMIVSRYIYHFLEFDNKPKKTYIWLHDTVTHSAWNGRFMPEEGKFLLKNIINKIDGIVLLTEWHKKFFLSHYDDIDPAKIWIIGNAIDVSRYNKKVERVKNRFIYTSNPNRGLRQLVEHFSIIKKLLPDAELWVYRGEDDFVGEYIQLLELIKTIPYIKFMGRFDNNDLVEHQMMADFWYYPTNWSETYCISALEAMAAGCICISSDLAGLKDTISDRGVLIGGIIHSQEYFEEATKKILEISSNDSIKETFRAKGISWARNQSWKTRVNEWFTMIGFEPPPEKMTVKLMCNWTDNKSINKIYKKFCKPDGSWNNVLFTDDEKADWYCIINFPRPDEYWNPDTTILLSMEEIENRKIYFPKDWIAPSRDQFFNYFSSRNSIEWHLNKSHAELLKFSPEKTKCISSVTSSEYRLPGHIKRINMLKQFESNGLLFDLYGRTNNFGFKNYLGSLPPYCKDDGILPYKYTIACENTSVNNYFTEKIVDAILGECLCFYYGCPNLDMFIDKRAYILIDPDDHERSLQIINDAIAGNEWEKRIDIIKNEKLKILNELQLIPVVESIITKKISVPNFLDDCSVKVINLERRSDRWEAFIKHADEIGLKNYSRFDATDGKKLVFDKEMSKLFMIKEGFVGKRWHHLTHNYWAGTLGCALSQFRTWQEISLENKDCIVFEDDIIIDKHFVKKWNDIYADIKHDSRWDLLYFGINDDQYGESQYGDIFVHSGVMKFSPIMRKAGGGAYGYVLRPKGAQKLINLVNELGIQQPIDHFMIDHFDSLCVYKTVPHLVKAKIFGITGTDTDIQNCTLRIADPFSKII